MINKLKFPTIVGALLLFSQMNAQVLDDSFPVLTPLDISQMRFAIEGQNKTIYYSGSIDFYNDTKVPGIVRLQENGQLDPSFSLDYLSDASIGHIAFKSNGNIVLHGFNNQKASYELIELTANGSYINSILTPLPNSVRDMIVLPNDEIILTDDHKLVKYDLDLQIDDTFIVETDGTVNSLNNDDESIIIGGNFNDINDHDYPGIGIIDFNGNINTDFKPSASENLGISQILIDDNSQLYLKADYSSKRIIRMNMLGEIDEQFQIDFTGYSLNGNIQLLGDGIVIKVNNYTPEEGSKYFLWKINDNGTRDENFSFELQSWDAHILTTQNLDVYVSGGMKDGNELGITKISNNTIDSSFESSTLAYGHFNIINVGDERALLQSQFRSVNGFANDGLLLIDTSGQIIESFRPELPTRLLRAGIFENDIIYMASPESIILYNDLGEQLKEFEFPDDFVPNSIEQVELFKNDGIIILANDQLFVYDNLGNIDEHFEELTFEGISRLNVNSDNEIILGSYSGSVTLNKEELSSIVKINSNGSIVENFNSQIDLDGPVRRIASLESGNIAIVGGYTTLNESPISSIFILNKDGDLIKDISDSYEFSQIINFRNEFYYTPNYETVNNESNGAIIDYNLNGFNNLSAIGAISASKLNQNCLFVVGSFYTGEGFTAFSEVKKLKFTDYFPVIKSFSINEIDEDKPFDVTLDLFEIEDFDSEIEDIKIDVLDGTHYQFSGTYVIPENNFNGELVLRVKVSDESDHSQTAQFKINVTPVNDAPTALSSLTEFAGTQGELIEMTLADFSAEDVDNTYPDDFTLKILAGTHYETLASGIQTSIDFSGNLTVPVAVNDGEFNSDTLQLTIPIALIAATPDLHSIQLFPNPATDYINFKNSPGDLSIIIRDLNGKELLKETPRNNDHCLDIRNLPNGNYLLELNSSENQYQQKIIIKH